MGAIGGDRSAFPGKIDLAHEPPFRLGTLAVHPGTRQLVALGSSQMLEPRVMQVLVALARAAGAIVTRDELSAWCWDGRIVGEDALTRALGRIRRVAEGIGQGSFHVETIPKVGYRLIVDAVEDETSPVGVSEAPPSKAAEGDVDRRRRLAVAALVGAAALAGGAWWKVAPGHPDNARAQLYYRKGLEARSLGLVESNEQAASYFSQAVRADPDHADAWGALARQKTNMLYAAPEEEVGRVSADVRSAAVRALSLDPNQADAQASLALIEPYFRRWRTHEAGLARVAKAHPEQHLAILGLGDLYGNVARWADAIARYWQVRESEPMRPGATGSLTLAFWAADRFEEAETESIRALERWPRFHGMWFSRMVLLTYGGKPEQAVAFGQDSSFHPSGAGAERVIETRLATARALISRDPVEIERLGAELLKSVAGEILNVPQAARYFAALGDKDTVFDLLDAYFHRRGRFAGSAPQTIHPASRLSTNFLFHPPLRIIWDDPRFAALTRAIGLDDYWRVIGFVPAHRRR